MIESRSPAAALYSANIQGSLLAWLNRVWLLGAIQRVSDVVTRVHLRCGSRPTELCSGIRLPTGDLLSRSRETPAG
jgi:hypothetical protein